MNIKYLILFLLIVGINAPTHGQKKKKRRNKSIETVIATGKSYLGTPYRWGGNSKSGIDCSGLIQKSYQKINIKLPRTAREQSKVGKKKGWKNLRKGDLVYFKFKEKGKGKWYHSGMISHVSEGKILFIHASSSKGVVESNLMASYYKDRVKSFRRVIK